MDNTIVYTTDLTKKENDTLAYLQAVKEFRRILKPGGVLYLSIPFGKHKNHGWFQVFDGIMVDRIVSAFSPSFTIENYFKYGHDGWMAAFREECKEALSYDMITEKASGKDYVAASGANVCLELVK